LQEQVDVARREHVACNRREARKLALERVSGRVVEGRRRIIALV
jgi:hypothetical protein